MKKQFGNKGIEFNPMGMGCWAIGGPLFMDKVAVGWGPTNDEESSKAILASYENGIRFYDTADMYGAGHAERLVGEVLKSKRDDVVIASKFGNTFDESTRQLTGTNATPAYIRSACDASLVRLGIDCIDLYQFHINDHPADDVDDVLATLEELVDAGKIKAYGWSTDFPERAAAFAKGGHNVSAQYQYNMFDANQGMIEHCEKTGIIGINRGPLAMGLLTGKYKVDTALHKDDVRGENSPEWLQYFRDGKPNPDFLKRLEGVREILQSGGRTLTQGALAWIWAKSNVNVPIPGIRTVAQATENAGALKFGALKSEELTEVEGLLGR